MLPDVNVIEYINMNKITLFQNRIDMFIILSPRLVMIFFWCGHSSAEYCHVSSVSRLKMPCVDNNESYFFL